MCSGLDLIGPVKIMEITGRRFNQNIIILLFLVLPFTLYVIKYFEIRSQFPMFLRFFTFFQNSTFDGVHYLLKCCREVK